MEWSNFLFSLFGIILGGIITWGVSKRYYEKASKDLKSETEGLRKLTLLILDGMEIGGLVEIARDRNGNILGYNFLNVRPIPTEAASFSDKPIVQIKP